MTSQSNANQQPHQESHQQRLSPGPTLSVIIIINDFSLCDPVHVAFQVLIQLLGFPQFLKLSSGFGFFSLFCEFPEWK